jgi:hypothetical protein
VDRYRPPFTADSLEAFIECNGQFNDCLQGCSNP